MYRMDYDIRIGGTALPLLTSVKISKDVTKLTDTATIICPAVSHGRPLAFAKNLKKWQHVTIELGYDGKLRREFDGYVKSVALDDNQLRIECEDALLLFQRVTIPNGELKDVSLEQLLKHVIGKVNEYLQAESLGEPLSVDCRYSYGYDKFTFVNNATAYSVMEQIQKEGAPNIYISDNVLHIVPQYTDTTGEAVYSMQRNICKSGLNLKWRDENDRQLLVKVESKPKNGKPLTAQAGTAGGDTMSLAFSTITDLKSLQAIADNFHRSKIYTGYEGSFEAWLVPSCDAGFLVTLEDDKKSLRTGRYYVISVAVEFSSSGAKRTVSLGASVNKG